MKRKRKVMCTCDIYKDSMMTNRLNVGVTRCYLINSAHSVIPNAMRLDSRRGRGARAANLSSDVRGDLEDSSLRSE